MPPFKITYNLIIYMSIFFNDIINIFLKKLKMLNKYLAKLIFKKELKNIFKSNIN